MPEPAYVTIAADYARRIRTGELPPGAALPSYAELAHQNGVSDIVIRKALELLRSQGLLRAVRGRGIFVAERPNLARVSPERQMEDAEETFAHESAQEVRVEREVRRVPAVGSIAEAFAVDIGVEVTHTITRATEGGEPISISDTYQPVDSPDITAAAVLEETVADRIPTPTHSKWLGTSAGALVKTVHQRYLAKDGRVLMVSDVSYPKDRYDSFVFRMVLTEPAKQGPSR